jgi:hypothetical protein
VNFPPVATPGSTELVASTLTITPPMQLDIIFNCMAKPKRNCGIRNVHQVMMATKKV